MTSDERLKKLMTIWPPPSCPTCHWWVEVYTVIVGLDGPLRPASRPSCGRVVPIRTMMTIAINLERV